MWNSIVFKCFKRSDSTWNGKIIWNGAMWNVKLAGVTMVLSKVVQCNGVWSDVMQWCNALLD